MKNKKQYVLMYDKKYNVFNDKVYALGYNKKPAIFMQVEDSDFVIFDLGKSDSGAFLPLTDNIDKTLRFKNKFFAWIYKLFTFGKRLKIVSFEEYKFVVGLSQIDKN